MAGPDYDGKTGLLDLADLSLDNLSRLDDSVVASAVRALVERRHCGADNGERFDALRLLDNVHCFDGVISATHGLSPQELQALVAGEGLADALEELRTAELSKHKVLLAAIMRMAARLPSADPEGRLTAAYRLLAQIEGRDPAAVRDVLASPQFGAWAADCAGRLWAAAVTRGRTRRCRPTWPAWPCSRPWPVFRRPAVRDRASAARRRGQPARPRHRRPGRAGGFHLGTGRAR